MYANEDSGCFCSIVVYNSATPQGTELASYAGNYTQLPGISALVLVARTRLLEMRSWNIFVALLLFVKTSRRRDCTKEHHVKTLCASEAQPSADLPSQLRGERRLQSKAHIGGVGCKKARLPANLILAPAFASKLCSRQQPSFFGCRHDSIPETPKCEQPPAFEESHHNPLSCEMSFTLPPQLPALGVYVG